MYNFRVGHNTISLAMREVSTAIIDDLKDVYLKCPKTPEEWKAVSDVFANRWNFPHTLGALDGKHVAIQKPNKSVSMYHNYKGFFPWC